MPDRRRKARPVVVLACGGYRSGSTLQYNLAWNYLEFCGYGRALGLVEPHEARRVVAETRRRGGIGVAKCHHAVRGYRCWQGYEEDWVELVRSSDDVRLLYSVRDWRDVAFSMCRKFHYDIGDLFDSIHWRENLANMKAWLRLGPLVQRYEDLLQDPQGALIELAAEIGVPYHAEAAACAAERASFGQAEECILRLGRGQVDEKTQLHWDHIASPQGGEWRSTWSAEELREVRTHIEALFEMHGQRWC